MTNLLNQAAQSAAEKNREASLRREAVLEVEWQVLEAIRIANSTGLGDDTELVAAVINSLAVARAGQK